MNLEKFGMPGKFGITQIPFSPIEDRIKLSDDIDIKSEAATKNPFEAGKVDEKAKLKREKANPLHGSTFEAEKEIPMEVKTKEKSTEDVPKISSFESSKEHSNILSLEESKKFENFKLKHPRFHFIGSYHPKDYFDTFRVEDMIGTPIIFRNKDGILTVWTYTGADSSAIVKKLT